MNSMSFLLNLHHRSVFMKSLPSLLWRSVMVGVVVNILTPFFNQTIDASLSLFVDSLDLLDFSTDELSCLYTFVFNKTRKLNGSGDLSSDLRTWLSAALINHETCIDGFDGTNSIVKELLTMVHPSPNQWSNGFSNSNSGGKGCGGGGKSINGVQGDVVVAADGTWNFTKIMDTVLATKDYNMKRFVIYIKR
ncbi:hypothetical protein CISIN_1g0406021mg, partial [Citrus sinensis]